MTLRCIRLIMAATAAICLAQAPSLASQTPADRADPSVIEAELLDQPVPTPRPREPLSIQPERQPDVAVSGSGVAGASLVEGAEALPASAFAPVIASHAGRPLQRPDRPGTGRAASG